MRPNHSCFTSLTVRLNHKEVLEYQSTLDKISQLKKVEPPWVISSVG